MPSLLTSWSAMVCYDVLSEGHTKGTHMSSFTIPSFTLSQSRSKIV
jgi:hypothetical protein